MPRLHFVHSNWRTRVRQFAVVTAISLAAAALPVGLAVPAAVAAVPPQPPQPPASFGTGSSFCAQAVPGGYPLQANFDGVYACGPANNKGTGSFVPASRPYKGFFEDARWTYQCVELANRFLFDQYHLTPVKGLTLVGGNYVSTVHAKHPQIGVSSPGTSLPAAGDIISMWGGRSGQVTKNGSNTHVAVVTSVKPPTNTGSTIIKVMEENGAHSGYNKIIVSNGNWSYVNGYYTQFQWLDLAQPNAGAVPTSGGPAFAAAFQANNGNLYTYSSTSGTSNLQQGMMSGTSPSITALPSGGYEEAFQANTGNLIVVGSGQNINTGQGMMSATSPAIAASASGFEVAFQANNGNLYTYSSTSGTSNLQQGMMSGTSPSITR